MNRSQQGLLDGVKATVAKYGLSEFTIRKLAEVSGINNGLIYHYFDSKEDVLIKAYCMENEVIFNTLIHYLDEIHNIPFEFKDKVKLWMHKIWRDFLSNPDRLILCSSFYHSVYFKSVQNFHEEQVKVLLEKLGKYFKSEKVCVQTMYSIMSILYDSALRVVNGYDPDTTETEEEIFNLIYVLILSQINEEAVK